MLGRKLREAQEIRRAAEDLESFVHHDVAGFDADLRPGACLVGADGRVLVERVEAPVSAAWSVPRRGLGDGRGAEWQAVRRDSFHPWR